MEKTKESKICEKCGKRIWRDGSFTQWIFKHNTCICGHPDTKVWGGSTRVKTHRLEAQPETQVAVDEADEVAEGLDLESDTFPVDRYKPLYKLGWGASGSVYAARDRLLKKRVAIKILHSTTEDKLVGFQSEAKATSKLNHQNIVTVYDFGITDNGSPYMALEFVDGNNLAEYIAYKGKLSVDGE